jgi:hypothetical protein
VTTEKNPESAERLHFSWAQGYMSGLNVFLTGLKRPIHDLNGWGVSDQMMFLRKYCEDKPLSTYGDAVGKLFNKLPVLNQNETPPQNEGLSSIGCG